MQRVPAKMIAEINKTLNNNPMQPVLPEKKEQTVINQCSIKNNDIAQLLRTQRDNYNVHEKLFNKKAGILHNTHMYKQHKGINVHVLLQMYIAVHA